MKMKDNYVLLHTHTQSGNGGFIDSTATYQNYIDRAKSLGMTAIAFTEHGNIMNWYKKKKYCEKNGLKYIHAAEFYITEKLSEKLKDNMHVCLYAKNFEGFKELNKLSSKTFHRHEENRYYYNPRLTIDELIKTSNNIIITTACVGGILRKGNDGVKEKFIDFMKKNANRCFLEIQPHNVIIQKEYNQYLLNLHAESGLKLTVGTDTHCLDNMQSRSVLQKSKNINFDDEDGWDLTFKDFNAVVSDFKKQGIIPKEKYLEALQNTNLIADMVEEFKLDYSNKYPHICDNPEDAVLSKIEEGLQIKGLDKTAYQKRIDYEMETYKKNGALQFILLDDMVKEFCRENNIRYGYGRGSVTGSFIAYLMRLTELNPIQWNLSFERFMSSERVSLADIDTDFEPSKRSKVKEFIFSREKFNCCEILTHNTIALKGAIRDVGRALEYELALVNEICNNIEIESQQETLRKKYPELFKYVDELNGTIVSVGSHPCGIVVFQGDIEESIGTFTTSTSKYPISQIDMKEIDAQNYIKLDILGLDNIELISKTCEAAGIDWITPDNVDYNDEKVWESIRENPCMIFQMESGLAFDTYRKTFSKDTLNKIKKYNPAITQIDILSMISAAIRPAGQSFRNRMAIGERNDNGHEALNEFLSDTMAYLTYQEQIIDFLHLFCGFTKGQADIVRRGIAKKVGTEQFLPQIRNGFIKTMNDKYGENTSKYEQLIESFLKVIDDASGYGFSKNHSHSYSFIGYICAWLRYYYPLEFITAGLDVYKNDEEKTAHIVEYAAQRKISINPIKFRHSKAEYTQDKKTNAIYKGIGSVKYCNDIMGRILYDLRNNEYKTFIDLLIDLRKMAINSRQLDILIKLDFFSEFGNSKELLRITEIFDLFKQGMAKQISKDKVNSIMAAIIGRYSQSTDKKYILNDTISCIKELELYIKSTEIKELTLKEKAEIQLEYLGYVDIKTGLDEDIYKLLILDIERLKTKDKKKVWASKIKTISIGRGKQAELMVYQRYFDLKPLKKFDTIKIQKEWLQKKIWNGYTNWYLTSYTQIGCD